MVLISLCLCAPAIAQTTRVETIAEQQAEKAKKLDTEGPSDAELVIRRVLISPLLNGAAGIYPWFGSVFGGAGMGVGVGYLKPLEKAASINVMGGISMNNSMILESKLVAPELWRGRLRVDASARWIDARGVSFYGLGPASDKNARLRYDYQPTNLTLNAAFRPVKWLAFSSGYSFVNIDTTSDAPGSLTDAGPGLGEALRYNVTRASVAIDWRHSPGYSTRGGFYRATWERHNETNSHPYSFDSQEFEFVLAPFLGSGSTLRGFATRRFTDRNRVLLTGEYRWRPSRYLDMAVFLDAGQVAADRSQFRTGDFETNWGVGARFHGPHFTALRVEVVRSREGTGLIVADSQIF